MFTVKTTLFLNAIEAAAVGGGKGFVLPVNPKKQKIGTETLQVASISSSNGEKTGYANFVIHTDDMEKEEVYYPVSALKQVVGSLAKITDTIKITPKGSYLELSDIKDGSVVRVELLEKDTILSLPNSPEGAVLCIMDREKFTTAIRMGGYCAPGSSTDGNDAVAFCVDMEKNTLTVMSMKTTTISHAVAPLIDAKGEKKGKEWHLADHTFIRNMASKLTGDKIQIAFTPKFIMIQCESAIFGCKKMTGNISDALIHLVNEKERDYSGRMSRKDLMLGVEIATVGCDTSIILMETNSDGSLGISSSNHANRTKVSQLSHEGGMEGHFYIVELLKEVLSGGSEEFCYYGKCNEKQSPLYFSGSENGVQYTSILAPYVQKNKA